MDILIDFSRLSFVALLALAGGVGLLALASPGAFEALGSYGNRTVVHTVQTRFEKRWYNIDTFVFAHGRLFGLLVIATVGYAWLVSRYGPETCPKSLLLTIVVLAMIMGIVALRQIMQQTREIELHLSQAHTDPLTGLANRRSFDLELSRRLAQRQRQGTPLCLLIIDVDKFKSFNDEFGHLAGDAILKEIANVLAATARHMDIVARLGGDEFAVLLPGSGMEAATAGVERLRSAIGDRPLQCEGTEHALTASFGLAEAQLDDDPASLIKRADSALYAAKDAGRNCAFRYAGPEPAALTPCNCPRGRPANGRTSKVDEVLEQDRTDAAPGELQVSDAS